jgi:hypothetical protein
MRMRPDCSVTKSRPDPSPACVTATGESSPPVTSSKPIAAGGIPAAISAGDIGAISAGPAISGGDRRGISDAGRPAAILAEGEAAISVCAPGHERRMRCVDPSSS